MPRFPSILRLPRRFRRKARRSRIRTMLSLLALVFILLAPFYLIYKPPNLLIRYFAYRWPDVLWHVPTVSSKTIALTIDDAPSEYTPEILRLLKANSATATFFIIGAQVPGREHILRDIVLGGHELANHALRDEPSRSLTDSTLTSQILAVEALITNAYSTAASSSSAPPKFFRPGSGFFSARMREVVRRLGYRIVLGSIYPHDPQVPWAWVNARHVLSMARPGGIVICHDRRGWTAGMLERVLPELRRKGYRVVGVGELLREAEG